jgi:hypothetical protein
MIVLTRFPDANRRAVRGHALLENAINRTRGLHFRTAPALGFAAITPL